MASVRTLKTSTIRHKKIRLRVIDPKPLENGGDLLSHLPCPAEAGQCQKGKMVLHKWESLKRYATKKRLRVTDPKPLENGGDLLSHLRSTIGADGLNFSVRNGKRWNPGAIAT